MKLGVGSDPNPRRRLIGPSPNLSSVARWCSGLARVLHPVNDGLWASEGRNPSTGVRISPGLPHSSIEGYISPFFEVILLDEHQLENRCKSNSG
jgi:hypothetical protein